MCSVFFSVFSVFDRHLTEWFIHSFLTYHWPHDVHIACDFGPSQHTSTTPNICGYMIWSLFFHTHTHTRANMFHPKMFDLKNGVSNCFCYCLNLNVCFFALICTQIHWTNHFYEESPIISFFCCWFLCVPLETINWLMLSITIELNQFWGAKTSFVQFESVEQLPMTRFVSLCRLTLYLKAHFQFSTKNNKHILQLHSEAAHTKQSSERMIRKCRWINRPSLRRPDQMVFMSIVYEP